MTTTQIATVTASVTQAAQPNNLQQRGAFVTQGGTTTAANTATLVSTFAELSALLAPGIEITSLVWASDVVTVTTSTPHGWTDADDILVDITGAVPVGYNGTYSATVTGAETFTYPLASSPGSATTPGTATLHAVAQLRQMDTTYFAGNGVRAVTVIELGEADVTAGVASLSAYIAEVLGTPGQQYIYLVPREWATNSAFEALVATFESPESMQYFGVTVAIGGYTPYAGVKSVIAEVEAPSIPATEFSLASAFGTMLNNTPSSVQKVPPLSYAPSYGTTAYPLAGNSSTFQSLAAANVGWIGTGAQGGIAGNILFQGKMMDGNFWNFWYSVDWLQVQAAQAIANEVINGSASNINPLYYNQAGINRLQNRVVSVANQGVQAGLGNGQVIATKLPIATFLSNYNSGLYDGQIVINAEPFATYTSENPNDYGNGKYAGLAAIWIPQNPFLNIFLNIQATTLISV